MLWNDYPFETMRRARQPQRSGYYVDPFAPQRRDAMMEEEMRRRRAAQETAYRRQQQQQQHRYAQMRAMQEAEEAERRHSYYEAQQEAQQQRQQRVKQARQQQARKVGLDRIYMRTVTRAATTIQRWFRAAMAPRRAARQERAARVIQRAMARSCALKRSQRHRASLKQLAQIESRVWELVRDRTLSDVALDELLTQQLLKMDGVPTHGDADVRAARKALAATINGILSSDVKHEEKQKEQEQPEAMEMSAEEAEEESDVEMSAEESDEEPMEAHDEDNTEEAPMEAQDEDNTEEESSMRVTPPPPAEQQPTKRVRLTRSHSLPNVTEEHCNDGCHCSCHQRPFQNTCVTALTPRTHF
eukprot:CAMPEP_0204586862 /NCGR_PEP_ID=MMETSP0661-20131031/47735_1 /ASSEMBLY_ACC=CAM_ASM_000606 /TAXON_ID=109239 /ORGANISM="Alexandrium margalefi, Strain AMGDE01CS-322" /LENGTH=357 /DNA_ID=CAMNT_0051596541 /DNA_START=41 /DNA_END=1114 /DNA_ORIENTATION=-